MSASAFKQLTDALVAACMQTPALAGGRIWPNRLRPLSAQQTSAIVVRLVKSAARETTLGAHDWRTQIDVECYGRGATGFDPAEAVDELLQSAWGRLSSIDPAALSAMAIALNPAVEYHFEEAETPMACAIVSLVISHRTPVNLMTPWNS